MQGLRDTAARYGIGSVSLHWIVAALALALLATGYLVLGLPRGPEKSFYIQLHLGIGWVAIALIALRLVWRLANPLPTLTPAPRWENVLARATQWSLLGLLAALAVTGYLIAATTTRLSSVFGWFSVPLINDRALHRAMEGWHGWASHLLLALVALHVAGALKRALINRDGTLRRMLGIGPTTTAK